MSLRVTAPAKVNLSLRVLGKRPDGFHEIRTLFQALDLGDELKVSRGARGVSLDVRGPDLGPTEENLAYRAAEAFLEAFGETQGVRIELTKWIPAGAGMGGGSSDAAAVLKALSWLSPFPPPPGELMRIGSRLGADVAFFLGESPLARGRGRGEILTPYRALPAADLVLALPGVHMSTAEAYGLLRRGAWAPEAGAGVEADAGAEVEPGTHRAGSAVALPAGRRDDAPSDWDTVLAGLVNDFQPVVTEVHPEVARSLGALRESGATGALLSGSGAASFGFFPDRATAVRVADDLTLELGWPFVAARTLTRWPGPKREVRSDREKRPSRGRRRSDRSSDGP